MAISHDTTSANQGAAVVTTYTHANITVNGATGCLLVFAWCQSATNQVISSPKYNNVAMTQLDDFNWSGTGNGHLYAFVLKAPDAGTHDFTCTTGVAQSIATLALNYLNVDQTTPTDVSGNSGALHTNSASLSLTPTVATTEVMVNAIYDNDGGTITASTNINNAYDGYSAGVMRGGDSIGTACVVSSAFTQTWSISASQDIVVQGTFLIAAPATGPANWKTLNTNVKANIKTLNTNTLANIKTYDTIT